MAYSFVAIIVPNSDYSSKSRVTVDSLYELEYVKYFENREHINGLWKLYNNDFEKLENVKGMPNGTIENDMNVVSQLQMRARMNIGEVLLIHSKSVLCIESLQTLINNMDGEEINNFIEDAKI